MDNSYIEASKKYVVMKYVCSVLLFSLVLLSLNACKKDEGKLPEIAFKTGVGYTSSDAAVAAGSDVTIGIHAEKSEEKDVLKKFNISSSTDGETPQNLVNIDLSVQDEDVYDVDYNFTIPPAAGHTFKLTFTVTNRDGLTNQVSLTLTSI